MPLYLLDTDLAENREDDRWITGHLYGGDQDTRIRQEIVLGIGGLRALRAVLPRRRAARRHAHERRPLGVSQPRARPRAAWSPAPPQNFDEAALQVAPRLAFTTHTPVAAGHDAFPSDLVEAYFNGYRQQLGLTHEEFMRRGRTANATRRWERFSMTVLALRSAARRNGVSQLHGKVSKDMWGGVGLTLKDAPPAAEMDAITNGVHTATWVGPEMGGLFDRQLGTSWRTDARYRRQLVGAAPASTVTALWAARTAQRARLLATRRRACRAAKASAACIRTSRLKKRWCSASRGVSPRTNAPAWCSVDPDRLERLMDASDRPLVIVFAGKAHPRDDPGKLLVQRIVQATRDDRFRGRLVFLENYDVEIARLLVQGSDVWMNTPRRPQEASGTSGMKATLNGALHLSELDGWWDEAFAPGMGWALGEGVSRRPGRRRARRRRGAAAHGSARSSRSCRCSSIATSTGVPRRWLDWVRRDSIEHMAPQFSAQRMVREYAEQFYNPAGPPPPADHDRSAATGKSPNTLGQPERRLGRPAGGRQLAARKQVAVAAAGSPGTGSQARRATPRRPSVATSAPRVSVAICTGAAIDQRLAVGGARERRHVLVAAQRRVAAADEQPRPLAAQTQQPLRDVQLDPPVLCALQQVCEQCRPDRRDFASESSQMLAAQIEVDRPTIVGIDQRKIPQLVALVHVGHPGRARASARSATAQLNMPKKATFCCSWAKSSRKAAALGGIEDRPHELQHRLLVLGVRRDPAGVHLGLFERLEHELADAPARTPRRSVAERPRAEQRLVQQVFLVAIGRDAALDAQLLAAVQARPARERRAPLARQLGQHVDARADVLAALGVVGRAGEHASPASRARARRCGDGTRSASGRTGRDRRRPR